MKLRDKKRKSNRSVGFSSLAIKINTLNDDPYIAVTTTVSNDIISNNNNNDDTIEAKDHHSKSSENDDKTKDGMDNNNNLGAPASVIGVAESSSGVDVATNDTSTRSTKDDAQPTSTTTTRTTSKCIKCSKRASRKGCTQSACIKCCTDMENCVTHKETREHAVWKKQVLDGNTPIQLIAQEKRAKTIPKGRFFEKGFQHPGDTIVLWDIQEYMKNDKYRMDAIRKSKKRKSLTSSIYEDKEISKKSKSSKQSKKSCKSKNDKHPTDTTTPTMATTETPTTTHEETSGDNNKNCISVLNCNNNNDIMSEKRDAKKTKFKNHKKNSETKINNIKVKANKKSSKRFKRIMEDLYKKSITKS